MSLMWHRGLTQEDVATAHRLLAQHRPITHYNGEAFCANAGHWGDAPAWPCPRARWAEAVLAAEGRGEIAEEIPLGA